MKKIKLNLLEKKEMNEVRGGDCVYWCSCGCAVNSSTGEYAFGDVNQRPKKKKLAASFDF